MPKGMFFLKNIQAATCCYIFPGTSEGAKLLRYYDPKLADGGLKLNRQVLVNTDDLFKPMASFLSSGIFDRPPLRQRKMKASGFAFFFYRSPCNGLEPEGLKGGKFV
ncbi:MAG: hypothetical protein LBD40_03920 [Puniceicoccales bacterium]|jgi:hypothetical protein|nr:hypothetical protein [Puniceicoccales bacterium]